MNLLNTCANLTHAWTNVRGHGLDFNLANEVIRPHAEVFRCCQNQNLRQKDTAMLCVRAGTVVAVGNEAIG